MLPLVDITALAGGDATARSTVAAALDQACRRFGFVRIVGHGADPDLRRCLTATAAEFFALPDDVKAEISMARAGRAWRGWFPVGDELTSGRADAKEGIYFGAELADDHPAVRAGVPLHGANLFPTHPAGLRRAVLDWMSAMTAVGQRLLGALAEALGLDDRWFVRNVTTDPTVLFRVFHYPPADAEAVTADEWGVREHTDYGLLTILAQDGTGGLEVRGPSGWVDVPADPDVLIVNLGDMLERMTRGLYRSTPHRVRNTSGAGRLSLPFFLDPSWNAEPVPIESAELGTASGDASGGPPRWDGADVHAWNGRYGDYLVAKVTRVFPGLLS